MDPVVNPEGALAFLEELDVELTQTGVKDKGKASRGKAGVRNTQGGTNKDKFSRPSYEDVASSQMNLEGKNYVGREQEDWPDMDEAESILSVETEAMTDQELRVVLKGIIKYQQHLAGYVEAGMMEISNNIESLTRKVEFLGVPSVLKLGVETRPPQRATFQSSKSSLSTYFLPGSTPPTTKICRMKLLEIAASTEGVWKSPPEITGMEPSELEYLRQHWNEGTVVAKLRKQGD